MAFGDVLVVGLQIFRGSRGLQGWMSFACLTQRDLCHSGNHDHMLQVDLTTNECYSSDPVDFGASKQRRAENSTIKNGRAGPADKKSKPNQKTDCAGHMRQCIHEQKSSCLYAYSRVNADQRIWRKG